MAIRNSDDYCSTSELARIAGVPRAHVDRIFMAIVDETLLGRQVRITRIGLFQMIALQSRRMEATHWRQRERISLLIPRRFALRFRMTSTLRIALRRLAKGVGRGTR